MERLAADVETRKLRRVGREALPIYEAINFEFNRIGFVDLLWLIAAEDDVTNNYRAKRTERSLQWQGNKEHERFF